MPVVFCHLHDSNHQKRPHAISKCPSWGTGWPLVENHCAKLSPAEMFVGPHCFPALTLQLQSSRMRVPLLLLISCGPLTFAGIFVSCLILLLNEMVGEKISETINTPSDAGHISPIRGCLPQPGTQMQSVMSSTSQRSLAPHVGRFPAVSLLPASHCFCF